MHESNCTCSNYTQKQANQQCKWRQVPSTVTPASPSCQMPVLITLHDGEHTRSHAQHIDCYPHWRTVTPCPHCAHRCAPPLCPCTPAGTQTWAASGRSGISLLLPERCALGSMAPARVNCHEVFSREREVSCRCKCSRFGQWCHQQQPWNQGEDTAWLYTPRSTQDLHAKLQQERGLPLTS